MSHRLNKIKVSYSAIDVMRYTCFYQGQDKGCGLVLLILMLCFSGRALVAQDAPGTQDFGGSYSGLRPEQKRLVDDWFGRFSAVVKKPVNPAAGYDKLPLSGKTTFNAVTHALLMTRLTDASGKSLASSALEVVDKMDGVTGQILGARGDAQFRIYVQMKPTAMALLRASKEFERTADNTIYHKGYPTCFRTKGVPSIQVSLTRDATRADIDVDYRSSRFPVVLVNGHLNSSNSDVRVGDNDARHNNQWAGLQNWWRNVLGLQLAEDPPKIGEKVLARVPKRKDTKPSEAIFDFLDSWLVQQMPNESIAYIDEEAYACMELEKQAKTDRGMAMVAMLQNMLSTNKRIGKVSSLADATSGVTITGERVKQIEQPHQREFSLYEVREDLAEEFKCANRLDSAEISPKASKSDDFGKYVGAVFRVQAKGQTGNVIATLWRKDQGYWKMITYDIDPELDRSAIPNMGVSRATEPSMDFVDGDKDMIKAASDFLKLWLIRNETDKAIRYFVPESLPCVDLYRPDDAAVSTDEARRELLRQGMTRAAAAVGSVKRLEEAIAAPDVNHPDLKLVKHADSRAFVVASVPEHMAEATKCGRRSADANAEIRPGAAAAYGKYFASGFQLNQGKASPAVLWLLWSRVDESWKVVSYRIVTP